MCLDPGCTNNSCLPLSVKASRAARSASCSVGPCRFAAAQSQRDARETASDTQNCLGMSVFRALGCVQMLFYLQTALVNGAKTGQLLYVAGGGCWGGALGACQHVHQLHSILPTQLASNLRDVSEIFIKNGYPAVRSAVQHRWSHFWAKCVKFKLIRISN